MADKLKKYQALRQTEYLKLRDVYDGAQRASEGTEVDINVFRCMYHSVENIHKAFYDMHNNVITLISSADESAFNIEDKVRKEFDFMYYKIKAVHFGLPSMVSAAASTSGASPSNITSNNLPKIGLPTFSGDITVFQSYIDLYDALIHNNSNLSDCEKFTYLLSTLRGTALTIVQHLPVTSSNYTIAYETLCKRFKNVRLIATTLWKSLESAPRVKSDNPAELRSLLDTFAENLAALTNLGLPTQHWDFILVQMILSRLDISIVTRFELSYDNSTTLPSYKVLCEFLAKNCTALDNVNLPRLQSLPNRKPPQPISRAAPTSLHVEANPNIRSCSFCKKPDHAIYKCRQFLTLSPYDRYQSVKTSKMCINCLSRQHILSSCQSSTSCHRCNQRHHTLLHFPTSSVLGRESTALDLPSSQPPSLQAGLTSASFSVLLSTARIQIRDRRGSFQPVRCLLDSGSMISFITLKCARRLGLNAESSPVQLSGLGPMTASCNQGVTFTFRPFAQPEPQLTIDALVLDTICNDQPTSVLQRSNWPHLSNLRLADEQFGTPGSIDVLLGADVFGQLLLDGQVKGQAGHPVAINTVLGYILMGRISNQAPHQITSLHCNFDSSATLDNQISRFWEVEEVPSVSHLSPDDLACEKHFLDTYKREKTGRFVVELPFLDAMPTFPGIRNLALLRFYSLERRLSKNPPIYQQYRDFINEYLDLDHMELVTEVGTSDCFYLPHHCVIKPESLTTKLRVVFNGAAHVPGQPSLNDCLLRGPKLQLDLISILLNFRTHLFVFSADIQKMYRQIIIAPKHQDYQRILWRSSPHEQVREFRIKRLVYGLNCSPFLALRTILQLAQEEESSFPLAADTLRTSTYVDDLVTGCSSLEAALQLQKDLISLLQRGGFELRKWASNNPALLNRLPSSHTALDPAVCFGSQSVSESSLKILGLRWNASSDIFFFSINIPALNLCTKRTLLSHLAQIFDPLGILTPVTFLLKHLIQRIWSLKLSWDDAVPNDILRLWTRFVDEVPLLNSLNLPRLLCPAGSIRFELHAFGDASEKGYCSVLYLRCFSEVSKPTVHFVSAKSKVAPLKTISLARLELCAAALTAKLVSFAFSVFQRTISISQVFCYSDSKVTLHWIHSSPHRWHTFVANRVSYIHDRCPASSWFYVPSGNNPADFGSRGLLPDELLQCRAWWFPSVLFLDDFPSPFSPLSGECSETLDEQKKVTLHSTLSSNFLDSLLERNSSLSRCIRILVYVKRFVNAVRKLSPDKSNDFISTQEHHHCMLIFAKRVQETAFVSEIAAVRRDQVPPRLRKLNPFIDKSGLLRVGGRLRYAPISYNRKFPILLPSHHHFTRLLIKSLHLRYLHAGIQTVHFLVLQQFWILSAKRIIRRVLSQCVRCWKTQPIATSPTMSPLPSSRVSQVKPFLYVGIDFAGPFHITMSKGRGTRTTKAYLCLFVCLTIKAIHLELVSDLSASAFIAAFQRFVSRRGRCTDVYSDCGTNFVKANKMLMDFASSAAKRETINWHFNPPSSPHFGGLWESNIKSVKTHLIRVVGKCVLTYEELYTLLTRTEAIVNSRPLTAISSDPNDLEALTPGHFLTLESLNAPPEPDITLVPSNRLSRWQLLTQMQQHLWSRWSREYLHTLHQRTKWHSTSRALEPGNLVVIKQDNVPPLEWPLARIIHVHPGKDGVVRVVTLRTANGVFKRPAVKVCPLPLES